MSASEASPPAKFSSMAALICASVAKTKRISRERRKVSSSMTSASTRSAVAKVTWSLSASTGTMECIRTLATGTRFFSVSSKAKSERSTTSVPWLPAMSESRSSSLRTSRSRMSSL